MSRKQTRQFKALIRDTERESNLALCAESNAVNPGSAAGEHRRAIDLDRINLAGQGKFRLPEQQIKCRPDVRSGVSPRDLMRDQTGRADSEASHEYVPDFSRVRLHLVQSRITASAKKITPQMISLPTALAHQQANSDVRGIKFNTDSSKVLVRTRKGTVKLENRKQLDTIRFAKDQYPVQISKLDKDIESSMWTAWQYARLNVASALEIITLESL